MDDEVKPRTATRYCKRCNTMDAVEGSDYCAYCNQLDAEDFAKPFTEDEQDNLRW